MSKVIIIAIIVIYLGMSISSYISSSKDSSITKEQRISGLRKDILFLIIPLFVVVILFRVIFGITVIQSASMEPTLMTGNTVFVNRVCYKLGDEVSRGDIVCFDSVETGKIMGKRVIGLPGDTIEFSGGSVYINGEIIDESAYLNKDVQTYGEGTFKVPNGCYFLMGDNRTNSFDSRLWEQPYIEKDKIMGRYMGQIDFSVQFDVLPKLGM